jgi:hypothetical protein
MNPEAFMNAIKLNRLLLQVLQCIIQHHRK